MAKCGVKYLGHNFHLGMWRLRTESLVTRRVRYYLKGYNCFDPEVAKKSLRLWLDFERYYYFGSIIFSCE